MGSVRIGAGFTRAGWRVSGAIGAEPLVETANTIAIATPNAMTTTTASVKVGFDNPYSPAEMLLRRSGHDRPIGASIHHRFLAHSIIATGGI